MATSVYTINKGINKPIEFKGLKAQYIGYLAAGLVALLILFAILYICGVNMYFCLTIAALLGVGLFMTIYRLSDKYGQHGLLKKTATRNIPAYLKVNSRKVFYNLLAIDRTTGNKPESTKSTNQPINEPACN